MRVRKLPGIAVAFLLVACGSSSGAGASRNGTAFALALDEGAEITAPAQTVTYVYLAVLGSGEAGVTFSIETAYSFAKLTGDVLALSPSYKDVGRHPLTVVARAGTSSDTKTIVIAVIPAPGPNTAPVPGIWMYFDSFTEADWLAHRGVNFTTPECVVACWLQIEAGYDKEGDDNRVEVEITPQGTPSAGVPTFTTPFGPASGPGVPPWRIDLDGLVLGTAYDVRMRGVDVRGGVSNWLPIGTVTRREFDVHVFTPPVAHVGSTMTITGVELRGSPVYPVTMTVENLPPFAHFDGATSKLTVTPTSADIGDHKISFTASGGGVSVTRDMWISVRQ